MKRYLLLGVVIGALIGAVGVIAQPIVQVQNRVSVVPGQMAQALNSQTTGAADTAVVTTLAADLFRRNMVSRIDARCSAGTSTITVESPAGTTIYSTSVGAVGITNFSQQWTTGLTTTALNTAIVVTLGTCGIANTGTLIVQGTAVAP